MALMPNPFPYLLVCAIGPSSIGYQQSLMKGLCEKSGAARQGKCELRQIRQTFAGGIAAIFQGAA